MRLLGSLPLEPEVVQQGDSGGMAVLDNNELAFTREFNKIVDEIVKLSLTERPALS